MATCRYGISLLELNFISHSKRNCISKCTHVLSSAYLADGTIHPLKQLAPKIDVKILAKFKIKVNKQKNESVRVVLKWLILWKYFLIE